MKKLGMLIVFSFYLATVHAEPTIWDFVYRWWAESQLLKAAHNGNCKMIKYYLAQGCNINTRQLSGGEDYSPLILAILANQWKAVKLLLKRDAHMNLCVEGSSLQLAVRIKGIHTPFIVLLWGNKDQVEDQKEFALKEIEHGNYDYFTAEGLKAMVSDFETFVNSHKSLPPELKKEVEKYKKTKPVYQTEYVRVGGIEGYRKIKNYDFN